MEIARAWRRRMMVSLGAAAVAALASISPATAESVLHVAMTTGDIPAWSGQPDQGYEGYRFVGWNLYDALVNWDLSHSDREASLRPGLATKWSVDSANPNRWLVTLRSGVKFHDGCVLTPEVVAWNYRRLIDAKAEGYDPVQAARMRTRLGNIVGVDVVDAQTVAISTKAPDSFMPYTLTYVLIISKCAAEKAGYDYTVLAKAPAGTGPYKFDRVIQHERLEMVRNAEYWDKSRIPRHDRLVLLPMPEATTRVAALLSGQVEFIEAPAPDMVARLRSSGMQIVTNAYPHNWIYQLNVVDTPFSDVRVRRAATYAINRDDVVALLSGTATAGYGFFPPSSPFYGQPIKYAFDPARATALLKEAGCYPCKIAIAMSTSGSGQMQPLEMNELVKSQLEAVGFQVTLKVMDFNALLEVSQKGRKAFPGFDAINISRAPQDPASGFLTTVMKDRFSPNGPNWGWFFNDKIDATAREALATFEEGQRDALVIRVHELVVQEAPMIFVAHDLNLRALSPRLEGFVQAQSWFQDLTPIVVKP